MAESPRAHHEPANGPIALASRIEPDGGMPGNSIDQRIERTIAEIRSRSGEAYVVELDLASDDSIKNAFATTAREFGRIDILVNNAGITRDGLALRMKKDDWSVVLETNLTGTFRAIQQVLQGMM